MEESDIKFSSFSIEELKYTTCITTIEFNPADNTLASGDEKGTVAIWDLRLSK